MYTDISILNSRIIQIVLGTPDGRILLHKRKKPGSVIENTITDFYSWDMSLRTSIASGLSKDAIYKHISSSFAIRVDPTCISFVSMFKPSIETMFGEVWAVTLPSNTPLFTINNSDRIIIAIPFDDILKSVKQKPELYTKNTAKVCEVMERINAANKSIIVRSS